MILLTFEAFKTAFTLFGGKRHWYGYPRAFVMNNEIYLNQDAFYLDRRDYDLVVAHEKGHLEGKEHTLLGVMCPYGLVRYLSTWKRA